MAHQVKRSKEELDTLTRFNTCGNQDGKENYLKLVLSNDTGRVSQQAMAHYGVPGDRDGEACGLGGELEADVSSFSQLIAPSSISLYFKSISRYPLLNEEEEKKIAQMINDDEGECNNLIMQWGILFQKKFLSLFPARQRPEIQGQLRHDHNYLTLFDEISILLKERKKIEHMMLQAERRAELSNNLQEAMNRVEAEISKSIAKIKIDETKVAQLLRDVERIPYTKRNFKLRKGIELGMRKALRAIGSTAAEIKDLKNQLVKANLRLVISIAKKYLNQGVSLADLIQEGNLGLMRAIDTYDHVRGHRLVTYATWWIKQAMIRSIDCQSKTVRTPVYVNEKLNQIMKASNRLLQECKREPTLSEIAAETNTPLESVEKVMKSSKDYIPLEYLVEDKSDTVVDAAQDFSCGSIPAQVASEQLSHIVNDMVLADLTDRERDIIKLRFGIGNEHDHTLEEIGRAFRLSRERIRQILETALRKMRTPAQLMLLREFANPN